MSNKDASPPSFLHSIIVKILRLSRINQFSSTDVHKDIHKRDSHKSPAKPPSFLIKGLDVSMQIIADWPVWVIKPAHSVIHKRVITCIHGGSYISEIMSVQWKSYIDLVKDTEATAVIPLYPLAPHGTASSVVPLMANLISEQIAIYGENSVSVIGDSAGGGLALASVQEIINRGNKPPAKLFLISPWLDVTISDPRSQTVDDPMLNIDYLTTAGKLWAGELKPSNPYASPLFGNLIELPNTTIFSGTLDLLYPDTLRLKDSCEKEGAPIEVDIRSGLIHCWAGIPYLPEANSVHELIVKRIIGSED